MAIMEEYGSAGNKAFEELKKNDADYIINHFTYSILEIFDMKTRTEDIIESVISTL